MAVKARPERGNIVQPYEYKPAGSILNGIVDQYRLTNTEYYMLYSFFVEFSMFGEQSCKRRSWMDYGWDSNETKKNGAKETLCQVLQLYKNEHFVFTRDDDLDTHFAMQELDDGRIKNTTMERGVFAIAGEKSNESWFLILFSRIRNCLAHGEFALVFSDTQEKMIVFQNHYDGNVKARCVLKLQTIFALINAVDKNHIIIPTI